jgi:hypothetical protein
MRQQTSSVSRANRRERRLNNSAVPGRGWKRPNALKHGVYAQALIMPGESPLDFRKLHDELVDEWKPSGPTQRDAVFDLVELKWRKLRLKNFVRARLRLETSDPDHPAFNEEKGLICFLAYLRAQPETCLEVAAKTCLQPDRIEYLKQKCPRSNYRSTPEWVEAIKSEISSVILPSMFELDRPEEEYNHLKAIARECNTDLQIVGSLTRAREYLEHESKEAERLDARITRQIKFLFELKAMEKMLHEK